MTKERYHRLVSEVLGDYEGKVALGSVELRGSLRTEINLLNVTSTGGWSPIPTFVVEESNYENDETIKAQLRAHIDSHPVPDKFPG